MEPYAEFSARLGQSDALRRACEHAVFLANGDAVKAANLMFRSGRCDICRGVCLGEYGTDEHLVERVRRGVKPVGSWAFTSEEKARQFAATLVDLQTFVGRNRWGMWCVVATIDSTEALCQNFIDEYVSVDDSARLYGYPHLDVVQARAWDFVESRIRLQERLWRGALKLVDRPFATPV